VTGRRPFQADTPMAVIIKQVTDPLPRPKDFVPDLPDSVEQVIFKALAKRPDDRYPDMAAFAAVLERVAHSEVEEVTAQPPQVTVPWVGMGETAVGTVSAPPATPAAPAFPPAMPPAPVSLPAMPVSPRRRSGAKILAPLLVGAAVVILVVAVGGIYLLARLLSPGAGQPSEALLATQTQSAALVEATLTSLVTPQPHLPTEPAWQSYGDEFDQPALDPLWSWYSEDRSRWSLSASPGKLQITGASGDMYANCAFEPHNLLLRPAPQGDFMVETHLSFLPMTDYQQAGLILFSDADHYLKLDVLNLDSNGGISVEMMRERGGEVVFPTDHAYLPIRQTAPAVLRVVKSGSIYTGYYSADGDFWVEVGSFESPAPYTQVGLFALTGCTDAAPDFPVEFESFSYTSKPQPPPQTDQFVDDFDQATLDPAWSWVNEDASRWSLTASPGSLQIVGGNYDIWGQCNLARNLLLQPAPDGDFLMELKLSLEPTMNYQQGALLVYGDIDNYLKLNVLYNESLADEFLREVGGAADYEEWFSYTVASSTPAYLRIARFEEVYIAYYRPELGDTDWTHWSPVGILDFSWPGELKVGMFSAANGCDQNSEDIVVDFDTFSLKRLSP